MGASPGGGIPTEDALYAMVNAIHRGEGEVGEARVLGLATAR